MRASRVAACFWSAAVGAGCDAESCGNASPSAFAAANAAALTAPNCFRNTRLVLSLQSMGLSFSLSQCPRRARLGVRKQNRAARQDLARQAHG